MPTLMLPAPTDQAIDERVDDDRLIHETFIPEAPGRAAQHRPDRRPPSRQQLPLFLDAFGMDISGCVD